MRCQYKYFLYLIDIELNYKEILSIMLNILTKYKDHLQVDYNNQMTDKTDKEVKIDRIANDDELLGSRQCSNVVRPNDRIV